MDQTQLLITDSDKTPLVEIFVWISFAILCFAVVARLTTKAATLRKLQLDDFLILFSLFFSFGQSLAVAIQCRNGFGQFITTLSNEKVTAMLKAQYVAGLLFILSICLAKISVNIFIIELTPIASYKQTSRLIGILIILWTISSFLAASFQCKIPKTWNSVSGSCIDLASFWKSVAIINIITDCCLMFMISAIAINLHAAWAKKITIIGVFGTRTFVVGAVAVQLHYLSQPIKDPAFDPWRIAIITQIVQCLSIVTACIPYLKPFLASLESGLLRSDDLRRRGETDIEGYNTYNAQSLYGSKSGRSTLRRVFGNRGSSRGATTELSNVSVATNPKLRTDSGMATVMIEGGDFDIDSQSQSSQTRIIKQTRTWKIDVGNSNVRETTSD